MLKKITFILIACFLFQFQSFSQNMELGAFIGASNYAGDLVPTAKPSQSDFQMSLGFFGRYNFTPRFSAKAHFYRGQISGDDGASKNISDGRMERNLSFRSDIFELGLQGEFNIFHFSRSEGFAFTPYLFAGVAGFKFNPESYYQGEWVSLRDLGTEGQGMPGYEAPYKLIQASIPAGLGLKFAANSRATIGLEFGFRKTFTDYLDDVSGYYPDIDELSVSKGETAANLSYRTPQYYNSTMEENPMGMQRGNPNKNDWYMFGGLTVSVKLIKPNKTPIEK